MAPPTIQLCEPEIQELTLTPSHTQFCIQSNQQDLLLWAHKQFRIRPLPFLSSTAIRVHQPRVGDSRILCKLYLLPPWPVHSFPCCVHHSFKTQIWAYHSLLDAFPSLSGWRQSFFVWLLFNICSPQLFQAHFPPYPRVYFRQIEGPSFSLLTFVRFVPFPGMMAPPFSSSRTVCSIL